VWSECIKKISVFKFEWKYVMKEKEVLASFISKLPEAIIICSAEGSILLHDYQSETYLLSGETKQSGLVTGKPITSIIDKNLIEHALDEINEQLKHQITNTVSTFILPKNNRILQTQMVPVLNRTGLFSGFVLILEDITLQNQAEKRVESLLKALSKNARSPMASIRAAIEAMKESPDMDENRQHQFVDIIHEESIVLGDILNRVSQEFTNLINVNRSLKPLFIRDLIQTISRRAFEKLGIICHIKSNSHAEQISIKADLYPFISAVLFILDRLKFETGVTEFYFSFHKKNKIVSLDIIWKGESVSPELIKQWDFQDIAIPNQISNTCIKDILDQHQSFLWTYSEHDDFDNMPYLRFFIPAVTI